MRPTLDADANGDRPKAESNGAESRLHEDIVAFERVVPGDCFVGYRCVTCDYRAALFVIAAEVFLHEYVSLCPQCVSHRIQLLRNEVDVTPYWVSVLQREAAAEVAGQARKFGLRRDTLLWNSFYRCGFCGRLIVYEDARWFIPPGERSSPAYCPNCIGIVRGDGKNFGRWLG